MITVLYVETGSGFGGSTQSLFQLLTAVDRRLIRPVVVVSQEGATTAQIRQLGVSVYVVPGFQRRILGYLHAVKRIIAHELPRMLRLIWLIRHEQVSVVHVNNDLYSGLAGLLAARLCRRPVVCHLRLTRPPTRLEQWVGRWPMVKIVLTHEAKAFYQPWWPQGRIEWVPNGVAIPEALPDPERARARLGLAATHRVVGLVARCVPGKGYEEFLRAAALIRQALSEVTFLIVGNGAGGDAGYETSVRQLAGRLGLNGEVVWAGWQPDAQAIYGAVDVIVQASSTFPEGLSRVVLEAMAAGLPVVATDIVGNREAVLNRHTGLLVPPGNASALAEAILTLLRHPTIARLYGEQGRARAAESFSLAAHARRLSELYDELVSSWSFSI